MTEPTATTSPIAMGDSLSVRDMKMKATADAIAKAKLFSPLVNASARSTRLRPTKVRPSQVWVHRRAPSGGGWGAGSRVRIARSDTAETANVTAWTATTFAAPSTLTSQPPRPGPAN